MNWDRVLDCALLLTQTMLIIEWVLQGRINRIVYERLNIHARQIGLLPQSEKIE